MQSLNQDGLRVMRIVPTKSAYQPATSVCTEEAIRLENRSKRSQDFVANAERITVPFGRRFSTALRSNNDTMSSELSTSYDYYKEMRTHFLSESEFTHL